jgi:hypothetical protein
LQQLARWGNGISLEKAPSMGMPISRTREDEVYNKTATQFLKRVRNPLFSKRTNIFILSLKRRVVILTDGDT